MHSTLVTLRDALVAEGDVSVKVEQDEPVASAADEDEAPYKEMGQSIASARNRERALRLQQIADALRRLAEDPDEFGVCESCGHDIPPRRLELMPYARLCAPCQSIADEPSGRATRKRVTDYR